MANIEQGSINLSSATVISVNVNPYTVLGNGKTTVTTAGTRVQLGSSTSTGSITVKALAANTGTIYVGNTTVSSSNGFQLSAGDTVSMDLDNLSKVWIDSSVNGEGVSFVYIV